MSGTRATPRRLPIHARMAGDDRSLCGRLFRTFTSVIEPFYAAAASRRNRAFDAGRRPAQRVHCPVISVGNITAGGTGKTPMVADVVEQLRQSGRTPAVLIRGYKSTAAGSDEATLLSRQLGGVPVIVNPDRIAGAARVQRDHRDVDVLVLDDGFQHRRIARDLDLVLIDATNPWGFGHVLPRGLLREPLDGLQRADLVIITRCDQATAEASAAIDRRVAQHHGRPPAAHTAHHWASIVDGRGDAVEADPTRRVVALCGIGNPTAFVSQVKAAFDVVESLTLADHHDYGPADVDRLTQLCSKHHADAVVTTEKDWVKLQSVVESCQFDRAIWRPQLTLDWIDGHETVRNALTQALDSWTPSSN
jgi:tetraacyldisaccharide 4'-kinase